MISMQIWNISFISSLKSTVRSATRKRLFKSSSSDFYTTELILGTSKSFSTCSVLIAASSFRSPPRFTISGLSLKHLTKAFAFSRLIIFIKKVSQSVSLWQLCAEFNMIPVIISGLTFF